MTTFTETTVIAAERSTVWDVLADVGTIADWNAGLVASELTTERTTGAGAGRHCDLSTTKWVDEDVVEYEPETLITFRIVDSNLPFADAEIRFTLAAEEGRTRVAVTPTYGLKYGAFGRLLDVLAVRRTYRKGMRGLLADLREHAETLNAAEVHD